MTANKRQKKKLSRREPIFLSFIILPEHCTIVNTSVLVSLCHPNAYFMNQKNANESTPRKRTTNQKHENANDDNEAATCKNAASSEKFDLLRSFNNAIMRMSTNRERNTPHKTLADTVNMNLSTCSYDNNLQLFVVWQECVSCTQNVSRPTRRTHTFTPQRLLPIQNTNNIRLYSFLCHEIEAMGKSRADENEWRPEEDKIVCALVQAIQQEQIDIFINTSWKSF